jgi:hypothetical protein
LSAPELGAQPRSQRGGASSERGAAEALARAVFAVLVLACIAAFFLTQHLKHLPTAVESFKLTPVFSPYPRGHIKDEAMSFDLLHADEATVTIIDTAGNVVATLVRDRPLARFESFSLRWNGRRGSATRYQHLETAAGHAILLALCAGPIAPAGEYRVAVTLRRQHKTLRSPDSFTLVGE